MIEILSHGNQLQRGKYALHSTFHKSITFRSGDTLGFIVSPEIGPGPLNIVLQGIPFDSLKRLEIQGSWCYLNGIGYALSDSTCYNATLDPSRLRHPSFRNNLQTLEHLLIRHSPPGSLVFLLRPDFADSSLPPLQAHYRNRMNEGVQQLLEGKIDEGVNSIKGLGSGLTPSGDDFLCGFLLALHVHQLQAQTDHSELISTIADHAQGQNPFSNAFLRCAAKGLMTEHVRQLIVSLFSPDHNSLRRSLLTVVAIGATSGADLTVGFLLGLQRYQL